ncbi:hypothetical protein TWF696_001413 [Orbilia brochopaga]|uniref:Uncharacterized protein n=1 Tax=Orbilia brochopaga TaxID=3140254 RepID=A0AAV9UCZ7_9PEZI
MAARLFSFVTRSSTHRGLTSFHGWNVNLRRRLLSSEPAGQTFLATLVTRDKASGAVTTHNTRVARVPGGTSVQIAREIGDIFKSAASTAASSGSSTSEKEALEVEDGEIGMVYDCSTRAFGLEGGRLPQLMLPEGAELLPPTADDKTVESTLYPGIDSHAIAINGTADDEQCRQIRGVYRVLAAAGSSEAVGVWG